jgi:hypothetical protein
MSSTKDDYRICPTNRLVIERKPDPSMVRWCFYMVTDSPAEAKRILAVLHGRTQPEQLAMLESE